MTRIVITRTQYEKIREVFEMYDRVDRVILTEDSSNGAGIGAVTTIEFDPKSTVKIDITDVESW